MTKEDTEAQRVYSSDPIGGKNKKVQKQREEILNTLIFHNALLIIISILFFLLGYAILNNRAESITMWSFTGNVEKVKDRDG